MGRHSLPYATLAAAALSLGPMGGVCSLAAQEESERSAAPTGVLVHGKVVDHVTQEPLSGATVSLGAGPAGAPGRGTRVTDEEGVFSFEDVPEGTYRLTASILGYHQMSDTLRVPAGADLELVLPLGTEPIGLEPIVVTAERSPLSMRAYQRRRLAGSSGFLITREEIADRNPRFLTELLHRVPGGMVVPTPPHGYTLLLRGQCRPGIWVDGVEVSGAGSIDQLVVPQNVEAVEVYHGLELPVEYGTDRCGGVLIWTRRGVPREKGVDDGGGRGFMSRFLQVVAVVTLVVLVTR